MSCEHGVLFLLVLSCFSRHAQSGAMLRCCTVQVQAQARGALPNSTTGGRGHDVTERGRRCEHMRKRPFAGGMPGPTLMLCFDGIDSIWTISRMIDALGPSGSGSGADGGG